MSHFSIAGWRQSLESNLLPIVQLVNPIEHEAVEMNIQIDGPAKALDESYRAALNIPDAAGARPATERGEYGPYENMENAPHQPRVMGQPIAQRHRERKNPLTDRHTWKNPVDKMSRGIRHPPPAT